MDANKALDTLFKTLELTLGKEDAKNTVLQILHLVVEELHKEGLVVSQETLAPRISKYTTDFNELSRIHVS